MQTRCVLHQSFNCWLSRDMSTLRHEAIIGQFGTTVKVGLGWFWLVLVGFGWFWLVLVGFDRFGSSASSRKDVFLCLLWNLYLCKQEVVFLHRRISTNAENVSLHVFHFSSLYGSFVSSGGISGFSLFFKCCKQLPPPLLDSTIICICTLLNLPSSVNSPSTPFTKAIASGSV